MTNTRQTTGTLRKKKPTPKPTLWTKKVHLGVAQLEDRVVPAGLFTGTVFLDYNANGTFENTARTVTNASGNGTTNLAQEIAWNGAAVTVTAFGPDNTVRGSTTTVNGVFNLNATGAGPFRLEFTNLPAGVFYGPSGTQSATAVQFLADPNGGTTTANLSLVRPDQVSPDNPLLLTSRYVTGAFDDPNNSNLPVIQSFPYNSGDSATNSTDTGPYTNPTTHQVNIPQSEVGSTWGLAYNKANGRVYAAAYQKRHTGTGPGGLGAIYQTAPVVPGGAAITTATVLIDLNAVVAGTPAGVTYRAAGNDYVTDGLANSVGWDAIGKLGLGGLDVSTDGRFLYVVALGDRKLYVVDINAGTAQGFSLPSFNDPTTGYTGITAGNPLGDLRPFAVTYYNGAVYVGAVNSAESTTLNGTVTGDPTRLRAYVFRFNPNTNQFVGLDGTTPSIAPVVNESLNYTRGFAHVNAGPGGAPVSANWLPWSPVYKNLADEFNPNPVRREVIYPQPMLTGLAFDDSGNIVLGLRDRTGDETGSFTPSNPARPGFFQVGIAAGDTLREFANTPGNIANGWVLENNGNGPGGVTSTAPNTNTQGPGGREFYYGDNLIGAIAPPLDDHQELSVGGVLTLPGVTDTATTSYDPAQVIQTPAQYNTGGVRWFSNAAADAGALTRAYELYASGIAPPAPPTFAKANGVGDLIAITFTPVEVGNRVWFDANRDGRQDADELGIAGVTVLLTDVGGNTIATTVTDANGNYYFTNAPTPAANAIPGKAYGVNLVPGNNYQIRIPLGQNALTAFTLTTADINGNTENQRDSDFTAVGVMGVATNVLLAVGEANHAFDAGFVQGLSLGDYVWNDANNDGIWQNTEAPIANVTVNLFNGAGQQVGTTTTNASGGYIFTDLVPGTYQVRIPVVQGPLNGFQSSPGPVAGTPNPSNNIDHGTPNGANYEGPLVNVQFGLAPTDDGPPPVLGLTDNATDANSYRNQDFGFFQTPIPLSLGDYVWYDANNDGIWQPTETPIANVTVNLLNGAGQQVATTTTNASGGYLFTNLTAGTYQISIPAGQAALVGFVSSPGPVAGTPNPSNNIDHGTLSGTVYLGPQVNVQPGLAPTDDGPPPVLGLVDNATDANSFRNQDFGFYQPLSLGDYVWNDANNDGIWQNTEAPIANVTVNLLDGNGQQVATTTTNASGGYIFTNLIAGTYQVSIPAGQAALVGFTSSPGPVAGTPNPSNNIDHGTLTGAAYLGPQVNVQPGLAPTDDGPPPVLGLVDPAADNNSYRNQDFGFYQPLSLGDYVWNDANNDGIWQNTEAPIANVTVNLLDGNGQQIATTTTNASGGYLFTNLIAGTYQISIPAGQAALVGFVSSPGPVAGTPNPSNNIDHGTLNGAAYLGPQVNVQPGLAPTDDGSPPVLGLVDPAADNNSYRNQDFGFFRPLSLGDYVWNDANNDGIWQNTEAPIANVTVNLLDGNGQQVATTTTNASGGYIFTNLQPGTYQVSIPAGQAALVGFASSPGPVAGTPNPSNNIDHGTLTGTVFLGPQVNVQPGLAPTDDGPPPVLGLVDPAADNNSYRNQDFGFFRPLSLGDYVWNDANNDGIWQNTEAPIANVTVNLLDGNGQQVATTTTNASGGYLFTNLQPGTFQVSIPAGQAALVGFTSSPGPVAGTPNPGNNIDHGTLTGTVFLGPQVNVQPGLAPTDDGPPPVLGLVDPATDANSYRNQDFGFFQPLSLGDYVWNDANNDGVWQQGEQPIAGVTVNLLNGAGQQVATTTTNANGGYIFTNLIAGTYQVSIPANQAVLAGFASSPGPVAGTPNPNNNIDHGTLTGTAFLGPQVNVQPGLAPTNDGPPPVLGLVDPAADNNSYRNQDFGFFQPLSLGDFVWRDTNQDGIWQAGENPIAGVTINLLDGAGNQVATTTTNANGGYLFTNLQPGTYQVSIPANQAPLAGLQSSPGPNAVALNPGNNVDHGTPVGANFVGPQVNVQPGQAPLDDGEPPVLGLVDNATNANSYRNQDFGFILPNVPPPPPVPPVAQISGYVYIDNSSINGLREYSNGERGIGGTRVILNGTVNGQPIPQQQTFTDSNGFYLFPNLAPGTYTVREEQPFGNWYNGLTTVGTVGGVARGTGGNDILSGVVLNDGDSGVEYNFGEIPSVATWGYVWVDTNLNGVRDPGEAPIPGVTVNITGTAFPGTVLERPLDAGEVPGGLSAITDSNGRYDFIRLPIGTYNISEVQPVDYDDFKEQDGDPFSTNRPAISNDLFTGVALDRYRGPFNFGEVLGDPGARGRRSPQNAAVDPSKREFLASTTDATGASRRFAAQQVTGATQDVPGIASAVTGLPLNPSYGITPPSPLNVTSLVVASGEGLAPIVRVFDYATQTERQRFYAFESTFTGSVRVASGDLNGDGIPDTVAAVGANGGPRVRAFDGSTGAVLQDFFAYESTYTGGLSVAVGDINGDGKTDIVTGTQIGGAPRVRVMSGVDGSVLLDFFAFDSSQRGGVRIAVADFNGDGKADIVCTTGTGVPTRVRVYDGSNGALLQDYAPYGSSFTGGVYVTAGDFNGDGTPDVITGADAGGGPDVRVFDGKTGTLLTSFFAFEAGFTGGVRVAALDINRDGKVEIVTAAGPGGASRISIFSGPGLDRVDDFFGFDIDYTGGSFVAGSTGNRQPLTNAGAPVVAGQLGKPGTLADLP